MPLTALRPEDRRRRAPDDAGAHTPPPCFRSEAFAEDLCEAGWEDGWEIGAGHNAGSGRAVGPAAMESRWCEGLPRSPSPAPWVPPVP